MSGMNFLWTVGVAVGLFGVFMLAMAIGVLVRGTVLRGGCHSQRGAEGGGEGCPTCGGKGSGECRRKKA
jgi:hypothetical protein